MIKLREYQVEAVKAVGDAWAGEGGRDPVRRPAIVLPTGAGKTVVFAEITRQRLVADPGSRVLVLAHREELVAQAARKLAEVADGTFGVGVVQAGRDETGYPALVGSVQTLAREGRRARLDGVGTVIVDECHHATARSYAAVLEHFGALLPADEAGGALALGVTATMARGDGVRLGSVWDDIVFTRDVLWMIRRGYLADVEGRAVHVPGLDLNAVRRRAGDLAEEQLSGALLEAMAPEVVAKAYLEHGAAPDGSLRPAILFAPTVESALAFGAALEALGARTATIHGGLPRNERRAFLAAYEAGDLDVLSSCMVLTEGFDSPRAEVAIIARATQSAPLYVQMVGRVLRPHPHKTKALVLDVVGATLRHELATLATLAGARPVEPKEGQTFLEAFDELEARVGASVDDGGLYAGDVETSEVDLFGSSRQRWLRTPGGFWFLPAGERYIAIQPGHDGTYDVVWYSARHTHHGPNGGWVRRNVGDIGYAMAFGESEVTDSEEVFAAKERGWRKRRVTVKALEFARSLGIPAEAGDRGGDVGDLISIIKAGRRMDQAIRGYLRRERIPHAE